MSKSIRFIQVGLVMIAGLVLGAGAPRNSLAQNPRPPGLFDLGVSAARAPSLSAADAASSFIRDSVPFGTVLMPAAQAPAASGVVAGYANVIDTGFRQLRDKPNLRNTCGAMCMLIVYNHFDRGVNDFTDSNAKLVAAVKRLYAYQRKSLTEYFTTGDIKAIMVNNWSWNSNNVKIRSTTYGYSYSGMIDDLNSGRPVITVMKGGSVFEPADDQGRRAGIDHFIVVFEANDSLVRYQDPWDGKLKPATKATFTNAWTATKVSVVGKP